MNKIGIGLAGFGTVGSGVYKNIVANRALIAERTGAEFDVRRIVVRDLKKTRDVSAPAELFTTDLDALLDDPEIKIVVELIGGTDTALTFVRRAIDAGKIVVTGNKALLAEHGPELFHLANEARVPIFYEAAVAGGIPIIKAVRESFVGNRFTAIHGILNGTSNYVLTEMAGGTRDFPDVLADAQRLGYAEADPAFDVNGWDAAHKTLILAALAYGFWIKPEQIRVEGIEAITAEDNVFAAQLGYTIKLLATIKIDAAEAIEVRVCPTLIPANHVLARVNGVFNAVWLQGDIAGEALFSGRGAGQDPTSSSVIADLADAALALTSPRASFGFTAHDLYGTCKPIDDAVSKFYLRLKVDDQPGVLAQIAGVLGEAGIGISSVIQPESDEPGPLPLVLMIHDAAYGQMVAAVAAIAALPCVRSQPALLQVDPLDE
jgi:homoserine dehydrogenase